MIVTWNQPRVKVISLPMKSGLDHIILAPGPNEVDDKAWTEATKNKQVKAALEAGLLVVNADASYASRPLAERRKLVSEAMNTDMLNRWAEVETHPMISKAIQDQIHLITHPKKPEA